MDRHGFVRLAAIAIGLVVAGFVVRGFGQLLLGRPTAELLQAPLVLVGFTLVVYLFVRAVLDVAGIRDIDRSG